MKVEEGRTMDETYCGLAAWVSCVSSSEADIINGDSIQILGGINHRPTCRKCIGARRAAHMVGLHIKRE